ncbi:TRI47 protein, partial [Atractosteus spatula]|nr:TRI47 protein [Atractosteus spatula]
LEESRKPRAEEHNGSVSSTSRAHESLPLAAVHIVPEAFRVHRHAGGLGVPVGVADGVSAGPLPALFAVIQADPDEAGEDTALLPVELIELQRPLLAVDSGWVSATLSAHSLGFTPLLVVFTELTAPVSCDMGSGHPSDRGGLRVTGEWTVSDRQGRKMDSGAAPEPDRVEIKEEQEPEEISPARDPQGSRAAEGPSSPSSEGGSDTDDSDTLLEGENVYEGLHIVVKEEEEEEEAPGCAQAQGSPSRGVGQGTGKVITVVTVTDRLSKASGVQRLYHCFECGQADVYGILGIKSSRCQWEEIPKAIPELSRIGSLALAGCGTVGEAQTRVRAVSLSLTAAGVRGASCEISHLPDQDSAGAAQFSVPTCSRLAASPQPEHPSTAGSVGGLPAAVPGCPGCPACGDRLENDHLAWPLCWTPQPCTAPWNEAELRTLGTPNPPITPLSMAPALHLTQQYSARLSQTESSAVLVMELHSIDATLSGSSEEMCAGYLEGSFSKGSSSSKIVPRFEAPDRVLLFLLTGLCALLVVGGTALGVLYAQSSGPGPAGSLAWNYSALQEEQQRLAVELLHLQGELDRMTSLYSSTRENRSLLWNELETLKNKHSGLQTKFTNISETHSALIRTLTDFRASTEEHLSRAALNYSSLQSEQEELEAKLRTLQNDLASLSSSFSEVKENSSSLWHQLDVLTDQSSLRIKLDNLSDTLSALMKTLAEAKPRKTCPDHWELFRRKCYFFSSDKESWGTSSDRCVSAGGSLVIIKSQEEQKFLTSKLAKQINSYEDSYWIGLNDLAAEGSWRWVDDTSLDAQTTFWASVLGGREPDNWSQVDPQGEDCVHIGVHNTFQEACRERGWQRCLDLCVRAGGSRTGWTRSRGVKFESAESRDPEGAFKPVYFPVRSLQTLSQAAVCDGTERCQGNMAKYPSLSWPAPPWSLATDDSDLLSQLSACDPDPCEQAGLVQSEGWGAAELEVSETAWGKFCTMSLIRTGTISIKNTCCWSHLNPRQEHKSRPGLLSYSPAACGQRMASGQWMEDQLLCPVCLCMLKQPVTTPCGHSYCQECIQRHWDQSALDGLYSCPQCRRAFSTRPVLAKSTVLAELIDSLRRTELDPPSGPSPSPAGPGGVLCDVCTGPKLSAVKSCVVCSASYCAPHLRPHQESRVLAGHRLVSPAERLQEALCLQHGRALEVYCLTDLACICLLCTLHGHRDHDTVPVEEQRALKQEQLRGMQMEIRHTTQQRWEELQRAKQGVESVKSTAREALAESAEIFGELAHTVERIRSAALGQIAEQERRAVREAEAIVGRLEKEMEQLRRREAEVEQLLQVKDTLHFLQSVPPAHSPPEPGRAPSSPARPDFSLAAVRKAVSDMRELLESVCRATSDPAGWTEDTSSSLLHNGNCQHTVSTQCPSLVSSVFHKVIRLQTTPEPRNRAEFLKCSKMVQFDSWGAVCVELACSSSIRVCFFCVLWYPHSPQTYWGYPAWQLLHAGIGSSSPMTLYWMKWLENGWISSIMAHQLDNIRGAWELSCLGGETPGSSFNFSPSRVSPLRSGCCQLFLDPNTLHPNLLLSEGNRRLVRTREVQPYPSHPERFDSYYQALCREALTGKRFYWEVEWGGREVFVGVAYRSMGRRGQGLLAGLGRSSKSWGVLCSASGYSAWHDNQSTAVPAPRSHRVGVFLDHSRGLLSIYSVSDTMALLHRFQASFTEPLYLGFGVVNPGDSVSIRQPV